MKSKTLSFNQYVITQNTQKIDVNQNYVYFIFLD